MELDVWKRGRRFKLAVYAILKSFPEHERFELISQLRRSVRSIPANISEGHGRMTFKDQNSFCVIARGSHSETMNHLIDAYDCGYITEQDLCRLKDEWDELGKVLNGYMIFLQSKIPSKALSKNVHVVEDADAVYENISNAANEAGETSLTC